MTTNTDDCSFVGVDIGGTTIKLGRMSASGRRLAELSIPTNPQARPGEAIKRISISIAKWLEETACPVNGIGLGTPGPLDLASGTLLTPVNLPNWQQFPIQQALSNACNRPVTYANDANAAAYGEYWQGTGREYRSLAMLTLGTGVGSGIVIDDNILIGAGHAAECGHGTVDYSKAARVCPCGQPGHLEAYASATAVGSIATSLAVEQRSTSGVLVDLLNRKANLAALDVFQAAEQNDPLALTIVDSTADFMVRGIVNLVFTIDPDLILLGGAMDFGGVASRTGQRFLRRIQENVQKGVFSEIAANLKIEFASLGGSAGWIGAAGLARRDYDSGKTKKTSQSH